MCKLLTHMCLNFIAHLYFYTATSHFLYSPEFPDCYSGQQRPAPPQQTPFRDSQRVGASAEKRRHYTPQVSPAQQQSLMTKQQPSRPQNTAQSAARGAAGDMAPRWLTLSKGGPRDTQKPARLSWCCDVNTAPQTRGEPPDLSPDETRVKRH